MNIRLSFRFVSKTYTTLINSFLTLDLKILTPKKRPINFQNEISYFAQTGAQCFLTTPFLLAIGTVISRGRSKDYPGLVKGICEIGQRCIWPFAPSIFPFVREMTGSGPIFAGRQEI